jgi:pyruvate formate lyase activating enzyme
MLISKKNDFFLLTYQSTSDISDIMDIEGYIFDIKRFAIHDGPGIRATVFFKGCPLSCWWCHNPESQRMQPETGGGGKLASLVGKRVTVREVVHEIEKETVFFDESGGGVTFSGGEPLMQPDFLAALLDSCKNLEIHTALDTCGYTDEEVFERIAPKPDLFLFDLKLIDDEEHIRYTGVSNRSILANLRMLSRWGKAVRLRFPAVTGITMTDRNLKEVAALAGSLDSVTEIAILPYHRIGSHKYGNIGMQCKMIDVEEPSEEELNDVAEVLRTSGLTVSIGG